MTRMGLLDISIVTDELTKRLQVALGLAFSVTGNAPDAIRKGNEAQVSFYLFHVAASPYLRNTAVVGDRTRVRRIPYQPLALDLYYLLSSYAQDQYALEQQAMSLAMKCLHENSLTRDVVIALDGRPKAEFCVTLEAQSMDDMARLWQSAAVSMRLSAVYKVSVVFLQPEEDPTPIAPNPKTVVVDAEVKPTP